MFVKRDGSNNIIAAFSLPYQEGELLTEFLDMNDPELIAFFESLIPAE